MSASAEASTDFDLLDALAARLDLLDRDYRLPDIFVRLIEMGLQLADAFAQQADVFDQPPDFIANLVGSFAHAGVFLDLLNQRDRQHESDGETRTTCARYAFCTTSSKPS